MRVRLSGRAVSATIVLAATTALASPLLAQTAQAPAPAAHAPAAALPSARSIIDRHLDAIGGRKAIAAHTSTHIKGTVSMPANGISGPIEVMLAKPNMTVTRITLAGVGEMLEGFDGKVAWSVNPMTGPMIATGKELDQKKFDADYYSELRDESRYESITTLEKTTFEGRPCYKVSLKKKGGGEDIEFYDVETGLKAGGTITREMPMGTMTATQVQSDYKKFGDVLQPTQMKVSTMGVEQVITLTSIEYDKVDPAVFVPPAAIKALIK